MRGHRPGPDLSSWPKGTRLIVRREPLHPGAQTGVPDPELDVRETLDRKVGPMGVYRCVAHAGLL